MDELCKNCRHCCELANTTETNQAICNYPESFLPIDINDECHFLSKKELTCEDCDRFGVDYACFTAQSSDLVYDNGKKCIGFIDKNEAKIKDILFKWATMGNDYKTKLNQIVTDFESEFDYPFRPK